MIRAASSTVAVATILDALDELADIIIAAQEVGERQRANGRPFLAYCARELEDDAHNCFHQIELIATGWEPTNHDDR